MAIFQTPTFIPDRESDPHDAESAHFFSFNISQELVSYVRLVLSSKLGPFVALEFDTYRTQVLGGGGKLTL